MATNQNYTEFYESLNKPYSAKMAKEDYMGFMRKVKTIPFKSQFNTKEQFDDYYIPEFPIEFQEMG